MFRRKSLTLREGGVIFYFTEFRVSTKMIWNSVWESCHFVYIFFTYSIVNVCYRGLIGIYFIPWNIRQYYLIFFVSQIVSHWPLGVLSVGSWVSWIHTYHYGPLFCFDYFLTLWLMRCLIYYHLLVAMEDWFLDLPLGAKICRCSSPLYKMAQYFLITYICI